VDVIECFGYPDGQEQGGTRRHAEEQIAVLTTVSGWPVRERKLTPAATTYRLETIYSLLHLWDTHGEITALEAAVSHVRRLWALRLLNFHTPAKISDRSVRKVSTMAKKAKKKAKKKAAKKMAKKSKY